MKRICFLLALLLTASACQKEDVAKQSIKIDNQTEYNLSQISTQLNILVSGAKEWTYDLGGAESWMKEISKSATSLQIIVDANMTTEARSTVITFKAGESSATVKVTQKGKAFEPELSLEPSAPLAVASVGDSFKVTVVTNLESWDAKADVEWVTTSIDGNVLTVTVAANPYEEPREAMVEVTAMFGKDPIRTFLAIRQDEKVVDYDPENLSTDGTSNCYIVTHRGEYSFNAKVKGNGKASEGLGSPSALSPAGAKLVWQTSKNMIKSVTFKDGVITFFTERVPGNALIAALDESGNIIWSWHIWFPHEAVSSVRNPYGEEVMSYNLGAIDGDPGKVSSYGLLYQWGRKDPFPGSPRASGGDVSLMPVDVYDIDGNLVQISHFDDGASIEYSIAHPTMALGNRFQYNGMTGCRSWLPEKDLNAALWGNPNGDERKDGTYTNYGSKSIYDPCPKGWRVPPIRTFSYFTKTGGMAWGSGTTSDLTWADLGGATSTQVVDINNDKKLSLDADWRNGWNIYINPSTKEHLYFPATTRYDGRYAMLMGSMVGLWGNYWYNAPTFDGGGLSQALSFGIKEYNADKDKYTITISPLSSGSQADAYAVRCIKE